jgi:hypothetical protein
MGTPMLFEFCVAAGLIATTVAIQALFMSIGVRAFRRAERRSSVTLVTRPTAVTVIWVLYLIVPIVLDVTLWAIFYRLAVLPSFEESLYFSTVTFTTVGYGDIVLSPEWRQLATFEAMNGWIIFGWATALIIAVIQRLLVQPGTRD